MWRPKEPGDDHPANPQKDRLAPSAQPSNAPPLPPEGSEVRRTSRDEHFDLETDAPWEDDILARFAEERWSAAREARRPGPKATSHGHGGNEPAPDRGRAERRERRA